MHHQVVASTVMVWCEGGMAQSLINIQFNLANSWVLTSCCTAVYPISTETPQRLSGAAHVTEIASVTLGIVEAGPSW